MVFLFSFEAHVAQVERFVREIGRNMQETPECDALGACAITAVVDYVMSEDPKGIPAIVEYLLTDPALTSAIAGNGPDSNP